MLFKNSFVNVIDNTNLIELKIIGSFKKKKNFSVNDIVYSSATKIFNINFKKHIQKRRQFLKHKLYFALIIQTKYPLTRKNNHILRMFSNNVIAINREYEFSGNKIHSYILIEIKKIKKQIFSKFIRQVI